MLLSRKSLIFGLFMSILLISANSTARPLTTNISSYFYESPETDSFFDREEWNEISEKYKKLKEDYIPNEIDLYISKNKIFRKNYKSSTGNELEYIHRHNTKSALVPVFNHYKGLGRKAGYFMCMKHDESYFKNPFENFSLANYTSKPQYSPVKVLENKNIYLHGLVRTTGSYNKSSSNSKFWFKPTQETETEEMTAYYSWSSEMCNESYPSCYGQCYANGNTHNLVAYQQQSYNDPRIKELVDLTVGFYW